MDENGMAVNRVFSNYDIGYETARMAWLARNTTKTYIKT